MKRQCDSVYFIGQLKNFQQSEFRIGLIEILLLQEQFIQLCIKIKKARLIADSHTDGLSL